MIVAAFFITCFLEDPKASDINNITMCFTSYPSGIATYNQVNIILNYILRGFMFFHRRDSTLNYFLCSFVYLCWMRNHFIVFIMDFCESRSLSGLKKQTYFHWFESLDKILNEFNIRNKIKLLSKKLI